MNKLLVCGASNSKKSINKQFAIYAAEQLERVEVSIVDLNDYASPLYSPDLEKEEGVHHNALRFYDLIQQHDAIVISLAEYNGLHTSAFKNLWDWMSRIPMEKPFNIFGGKSMLLLSTSVSRRPQNNVLPVSKRLFPHFGANIIADFYLPSFTHSFVDGVIQSADLRVAFEEQVAKFQVHLDESIERD